MICRCIHVKRPDSLEPGPLQSKQSLSNILIERIQRFS